MYRFYQTGIPADIKSKFPYGELLGLFYKFVAAEALVVRSKQLAEEVLFLNAVLETRVLQGTHGLTIALSKFYNLF